jgi:hypothetical protein
MSQEEKMPSEILRTGAGFFSGSELYNGKQKTKKTKLQVSRGSTFQRF